jgi:outer membrane protein OmpA-like peptidoglycan-associated protein
MQREYIELKDSFPDAEVKMLNDSIKLIFPDNIMFNTNESKLLISFADKLLRFTNIFNKYSKTNLLITGYTDNTGVEEQNINLSMERATHVKGKMVENKAKSERILTWGLGQKAPIASNDTEAGRAKNRRVEFVILFNSK